MSQTTTASKVSARQPAWLIFLRIALGAIAKGISETTAGKKLVSLQINADAYH